MFPLRYDHRNGMSLNRCHNDTIQLSPAPGDCITSVSKNQGLGLLVPVGSTYYYASTSGLSTRWSRGGLTTFTVWETSS